MDKASKPGNDMIMLKSDMSSITHEIPVKGLQAVYLACERRSGRHNFFTTVYCYEVVFCYEDGTYLSMEERIFHAKDYRALIREYDDSVKIYEHKKMEESAPLFCPFLRLRAEEPFVKKEVMENLNMLCDKNCFWRLAALFYQAQGYTIICFLSETLRRLLKKPKLFFTGRFLVKISVCLKPLYSVSKILYRPGINERN